MVGFYSTLFAFGLPAPPSEEEKVNGAGYEKRKEQIQNILESLGHQDRDTEKQMQEIRENLSPKMVRNLLKSRNMKELVFLKRNEQILKREIFLFFQFCLYLDCDNLIIITLTKIFTAHFYRLIFKRKKKSAHLYKFTIYNSHF